MEHRPPHPGVRPLAAAATCAAQGPRPRLCAPPKTLRTLQPTPPASQPAARHRVPWTAACGASALDFSPSRFRFHPGGSLAVAGALHPPCAGRAGGAGAAFQMTTSPGRTAPRGQIGPLCRPCPCPPTPSLPRLGERAQHLLLPSPPAAEDHTLRSALSTHPPAAAGEGEGALLLFPGGGRSVWGAGDAAELGIPDGGCSLPAALPAAVAAAVEIVLALCRPHLSYLIHHYRIPPNRGAPQHFAT